MSFEDMLCQMKEEDAAQKPVQTRVERPRSTEGNPREHGRKLHAAMSASGSKINVKITGAE